MLINTRSSNKESVLIHDLLEDGNVDLVCIIETGLGEGQNVNLSHICPPGYSIQHRPGANG